MYNFGSGMGWVGQLHDRCRGGRRGVRQQQLLWALVRLHDNDRWETRPRARKKRNRHQKNNSWWLNETNNMNDTRSQRDLSSSFSSSQEDTGILLVNLNSQLHHSYERKKYTLTMCWGVSALCEHSDNPLDLLKILINLLDISWNLFYSITLTLVDLRYHTAWPPSGNPLHTPSSRYSFLLCHFLLTW